MASFDLKLTAELRYLNAEAYCCIAKWINPKL